MSSLAFLHFPAGFHKKVGTGLSQVLPALGVQGLIEGVHVRFRDGNGVIASIVLTIGTVNIGADGSVYGRGGEIVDSDGEVIPAILVAGFPRIASMG